MTKAVDSEFEACLKRRLVQGFADGPRVADREAARGARTLGIARETLGRGDFEWATTQAYYAAFYAARAMILARGYRESGSHGCLWIAVRALYVSSGELSASLIERAIRAKRLREDANYEGNFSRTGAEDAIETAEALVGVARRLMGQRQLL